MINKKALILDSGASQHFKSSKEDFIDYEVITDVPGVQIASAKTIFHVEGQGSILLSHLIENKWALVIVTMRIYPVLYIRRLSMKLLSMGFFLVNDNHKVHGNRFHITFHNAKSHKPLLSALRCFLHKYVGLNITSHKKDLSSLSVIMLHTNLCAKAFK